MRVHASAPGVIRRDSITPWVKSLFGPTDTHFGCVDKWLDRYTGDHRVSELESVPEGPDGGRAVGAAPDDTGHVAEGAAGRVGVDPATLAGGSAGKGTRPVSGCDE
jgi:hypothetical protein